MTLPTSVLNWLLLLFLYISKKKTKNFYRVGSQKCDKNLFIEIYVWKTEYAIIDVYAIIVLSKSLILYILYTMYVILLSLWYLD